MTELSQYQTVFRISKTASKGNAAQPRGSKRNRPQISCLACRSRKAKCDRQSPCSSCSRRGDGALCSYPSSEVKTHDGIDVESNPLDAQSRLQKLEEMVTGLMKSTTGNSEPLDRPPVELQGNTRIAKHVPTPTSNDRVGHLATDGVERNYIGATHWSAILGDIRDIQKALENNVQEADDHVTNELSAAPDMVFASSGKLTFEAVSQCLPPKVQADSLISSFFNDGHCFQIPIIHRDKFQREYQAFWVDHTSMSFLWISILFSMLYISSRLGSPGGSLAIEQPLHARFFEMAGRALVTGQYQKAKPYSVEAVFLHGLCKYFFKGDPQADSWMVIGISARLAIRMGYHRDPSHLANVSPFEGEMRRRIFFTLEIFDLMFSLRAGLPPLIHEEDCDSASPSNLLDSDFDENCRELPPSRPVTDPTPMLYFCYKSRLMRTFRRIVRGAVSIRCSSYDEIMKLDSDLHRLHSEVPPSLQYKLIAASILDNYSTIMNRINIIVMYQQCLCILHRRYLSHDTLNPAFKYSRKTCGDAALRLLELQREMHAAAKSGDAYDPKWIPSELLLYSFLLAAMLVSLDLFESQKRSCVAGQDNDALSIKYDALRQSYDICTAMKNVSQDAKRASHVIAVMLNKLRNPTISGSDTDQWKNTTQSSQIEVIELVTATTPSDSENTPPLYAPEIAMTTDSDLHLNSIFGDYETIDWNVLDQYLFGGDEHAAERPWNLYDV